MTKDEFLRRFNLKNLDDASHRYYHKGHLKNAAVLVLLHEQQIKNSQQLKVLLTKRAIHLRHHAGQICFPGGKIEDNETILEGVIRELLEETGLLFHKPFELNEDDYVGIIKSTITNKKDYEVSIYYKRYIALFLPQVEINEESSGYIWTSKPKELNLAGNTDKMFELMLKMKRMNTDLNFNREEKLKRIQKNKL